MNKVVSAGAVHHQRITKHQRRNNARVDWLMSTRMHQVLVLARDRASKGEGSTRKPGVECIPMKIPAAVCITRRRDIASHDPARAIEGAVLRPGILRFRRCWLTSGADWCGMHRGIDLACTEGLVHKLN